MSFRFHLPGDLAQFGREAFQLLPKLPNLALHRQDAGFSLFLGAAHQDAVRGDHVPVEGYVGAPHAVAIPEPQGALQVAHQEGTPQQAVHKVPALRRHPYDLGQGCDHAFLSPVRGKFLTGSKRHRHERSPPLTGFLEVLEGGKAFGLVPDDHGLDPLAEHRLHGPFVRCVGLDQFSDDPEYPAFAVSVPVPQVVLQHGPDAGGGPVPLFLYPGERVQAGARCFEPGFCFPAGIRHHVEARGPLGQERSRLLPRLLRRRKGLPNLFFRRARPPVLLLRAPGEGFRLRDPVVETRHRPRVLLDHLLNRLRTGEGIRVESHAHHEVGLRLLGHLPGFGVPAQRFLRLRRQAGKPSAGRCKTLPTLVGDFLRLQNTAGKLGGLRRKGYDLLPRLLDQRGKLTRLPTLPLPFRLLPGDFLLHPRMGLAQGIHVGFRLRQAQPLRLPFRLQGRDLRA